MATAADRAQQWPATGKVSYNIFTAVNGRFLLLALLLIGFVYNKYENQRSRRPA